jgi:hypothetical protein
MICLTYNCEPYFKIRNECKADFLLLSCLWGRPQGVETCKAVYLIWAILLVYYSARLIIPLIKKETCLCQKCIQTLKLICSNGGFWRWYIPLGITGLWACRSSGNLTSTLLFFPNTFELFRNDLRTGYGHRAMKAFLFSKRLLILRRAKQQKNSVIQTIWKPTKIKSLKLPMLKRWRREKNGIKATTVRQNVPNKAYEYIG